MQQHNPNNEQKIAIFESIKPYESRIPLHPIHFENVLSSPPNKLIFQTNYGKHFGTYDASIHSFGFSTIPREDLLHVADIIFLLKPTIEDLKKVKKHATIIGWCHTIQQIEIAQIATKKALTLISMEAMHKWKQGKKHQHLFIDNNLLAGKLAIDHALEHCDIDYAKSSKIALISFSTVNQAAIQRLLEKGFKNITVFSQRPPNEIHNKISNISYEPIYPKHNTFIDSQGCLLEKRLLQADIIVNGILQDPIHPYIFLRKCALRNYDKKLIIDISCDDKMGFDFASSTTIKEPLLNVHNNYYYAVDHVPTLTPNRASLSISKELLPIINGFLSNHFEQDMQNTLQHATDIQNGAILNKSITEYQKASGQFFYPEKTKPAPAL